MEYFISLSKEFQSLPEALGCSPSRLCPAALAIALFRASRVLGAVAVPGDPLRRQITGVALAAAAQTSLRVCEDVCEMLLYPLRQGVEGSDLFEVSIGDGWFFFWGSQGQRHFVPSVLIVSTVDYQQIILDR